MSESTFLFLAGRKFTSVKKRAGGHIKSNGVIGSLLVSPFHVGEETSLANMKSNVLVPVHGRRNVID